MDRTPLAAYDVAGSAALESELQLENRGKRSLNWSSSGPDVVKRQRCDQDGGHRHWSPQPAQVWTSLAPSTVSYLVLPSGGFEKSRLRIKLLADSSSAQAATAATPCDPGPTSQHFAPQHQRPSTPATQLNTNPHHAVSYTNKLSQPIVSPFSDLAAPPDSFVAANHRTLDATSPNPRRFDPSGWPGSLPLGNAEVDDRHVADAWWMVGYEGFRKRRGSGSPGA